MSDQIGVYSFSVYNDMLNGRTFNPAALMGKSYDDVSRLSDHEKPRDLSQKLDDGQKRWMTEIATRHLAQEIHNERLAKERRDNPGMIILSTPEIRERQGLSDWYLAEEMLRHRIPLNVHVPVHLVPPELSGQRTRLPVTELIPDPEAPAAPAQPVISQAQTPAFRLAAA